MGMIVLVMIGNAAEYFPRHEERNLINLSVAFVVG